jgi:pyruvate/2-oxoglutarate dehydrogenase complex dihydrolipoamide acyltransferase (E2) component
MVVPKNKSLGLRSLSMPIALLIGCLLPVTLSACSSTPPASTATSPAASTATSPAASTATSPAAASTAPQASGEQPHTHEAGRMIVESDGIHLELAPFKEANQTHLDVFVQRSDNHSIIADAQVSVQVQTPDGQTQTVPMKYDAADKHFGGNLPGAAKGQYQVRIAAVVSGKTIDGRFSFER